MKAQLDWQVYGNQERGAKRNSKTPTISFNDIWQIVLAHLKLSVEPRVWQTRDEIGRSVWSAYDPVSGKSIHQVPSDRLRSWLESY